MATITGLGGDDSIHGWERADLIRGLAGADTLDGREGADTLLGGAGFDSLVGGTGSDSLFGGSGNDTLDPGTGGTGGGAIETLDGGNGNDLILITGSGAGDLLILAGGAGEDRVVVTGTARLRGFGPNASIETWEGGGHTVYGSDFNDRLDFSATAVRDVPAFATGAGNDTVIGTTGAERLDGGAGRDFLSGGAGDDTLVGGTGNDSLVGGEGTDTFAWFGRSFAGGDVTAGAADTVTGAAGDRLDFSAAMEQLLRQGGVALSAVTTDVVLGGTFGAGTNVRFDAATHALQIDIDGDASFAAAADFRIALPGVSSVTYDAAHDWFVLS